MDSRAVALAACLAVMLCLPAEGHARFGSAGGRGAGGGGHSGGSRGGSSQSSGGGGGRSRAVVTTSGGSSGSTTVVSPRKGYWMLPGPWNIAPHYAVGASLVLPPTYVAPGVVATDTSASYADAEPPPPSAALTLNADLGLSNAAVVVGAHAFGEGERLGVSLDYTGLFRTDAPEEIHLGHAHLSFAFLTGVRGRLRGELGLHIAAAPDVTFFAPGGGVSGVVQLAGAIGIEGRFYANIYPYTQLDARGGMVWAHDNLAVLVGARALYLNDNGALGEANAGETSDFFFGPYLGLALAI